MRFLITLFVSAFIVTAAAQNAPRAEPAPVTVPMTLDHNRVTIDVQLTLPDGSTKLIKGWVDNGNPDLFLSRRVASLMDLTVSCDGQMCTAQPPKSIAISGMTIPLTEVKEAKIPLRPVSASSVLFPGMTAEINIPSIILRNYDVLIDFPGRELTIATRGAIHFKGASNKVHVDPDNGLIEVPSQIENKKYILALDMGSPVSLLSSDLFEKLANAHPDWPHMTGSVGPANIWGTQNELQQKLLRLDRLQFGSLYLIDVPAAQLSADKMAAFKQRPSAATIGLLGADALLNYRVGLDYAHSLVYFDIGRMFNFPEFDVVGLILRPEDDGRYTIIGVADFDGKPSVPEVRPGDHLIAIDGIPVANSTMGQVWTMLGGSPGQERRLTIERSGKESVVAAEVEHFLATTVEENQNNKKSPKNK